MFHVVLSRSGEEFQPGRPLEEQSRWPEHAAFMDHLVDTGFVVIGGPLPDALRVVMAVDADSEEDVRVVLAQDPWSGSHLQLATVEAWTIRMDSRDR